MRKLAVAIVFLGFTCGIFAQESVPVTDDKITDDTALLEETEEVVWEDPFADLFDEAEDISVENQEPATPVSIATTSAPVEDKPVNIFFKPLTLSGHLEGEVGIAVSFHDSKPDFTGALLLKNDLNLSARISKNLGMTGTITVQYPDFSLKVSSLYFDYLLLDKVYVSGGKKTINWGYVQLFNDLSFFDFNFHQILQEEKKYIPTNILSDSENMVSLHVQVPLWTGTISGVMLYPTGRSATPKFADFTYAGSIEMTVWNTAINFFGRKNPSDTSDLSKNGAYRPPVLGLELKRTVLKTDIYGQVVAGIQDFKSLTNKNGYESIISTVGFYRMWDGIIPKVGVSIEYQYVYAPHGETVHTHRTAFLGGLSSLGPKKNMKIALDWNHQYIINEGELKLGFTVNNVLPHANWKAGLEMLYGEAYGSIPKFTLATSIVLLMDY